jgi:hypothetical protein
MKIHQRDWTHEKGFAVRHEENVLAIFNCQFSISLLRSRGLYRASACCRVN